MKIKKLLAATMLVSSVAFFAACGTPEEPKATDTPEVTEASDTTTKTDVTETNDNSTSVELSIGDGEETK